MRIGAIVQARMTSSRLPGKVLKSMHGQPMLQYLLDRLAHANGLTDLIVATSTDRSDDQIEQFCRTAGVRCARGSRDDVASRFRDVLDAWPLDAFVRICADSPLLDQRIVETAIRVYTTESVDVVRSDVFKAVFPRLVVPSDREHVTPFFYRHEDEFRIHRLLSTPSLGMLHMAVDTPSDFDRASTMLERMDRPHWDYDLAQLLELSAAIGANETA
jgi:spore coat polysaccharide biosynthesis protein SpsF